MIFYTVNNLTMNEKPAVNKIHISAGFGGSPTADSRFAVPCPADGQSHAIRNDNLQFSVSCNPPTGRKTVEFFC